MVETNKSAGSVFRTRNHDLQGRTAVSQRNIDKERLRQCMHQLSRNDHSTRCATATTHEKMIWQKETTRLEQSRAQGRWRLKNQGEVLVTCKSSLQKYNQ